MGWGWRACSWDGIGRRLDGIEGLIEVCGALHAIVAWWGVRLIHRTQAAGAAGRGWGQGVTEACGMQLVSLMASHRCSALTLAGSAELHNPSSAPSLALYPLIPIVK